MNIPITAEEKLTTVLSLQKKFHRQGELLLPDEGFYVETISERDLENSVKKILVWLGVKPTSVEFHITSTKSGYFVNDGVRQICLADNHTSNSFVATAIVARACICYLLDKKKISLAPEIIEQSLIELGLGLIILNAIDNDAIRTFTNHRSRFYTPQISSEVLNYFSINEFLLKFTNYIRTNELPLKVIHEHTLPWVENLLPEIIEPRSSLHYEPYVIQAKNKQRTKQVKFVEILVCLIILTTIFGVLYSKLPRKLSPDLQTQKDTIETLNLAYNKCMDSLREKQATYNDNDFFLIRQLDAQLSRCTSIKNNHDFQVNDYNHKLSEQNLL